MIHLVLKSSEKVRTMLPRFEQFLEVYDLKIVERSENKNKGTIKLSVNARIFPEIRWVTNISYDFFEEDVIGITTTY
jgi:hypothetical protein